LIACQNCKLMFRHPVDTPEFLHNFYQSAYQPNFSKQVRSITELPTDDELVQLMRNNFPGKRDHSPFIRALLKSDSGRILDFGCSWGYSIYQLRQAGYDAEGFETSRMRAEFGKKIQVQIHYDLDKVRPDLDLIMSNHAIEHLPIIKDFVNFSIEHLKDDGIFMAFCPNGSPEFKNREPHTFHVNWGFLHPNYLDVEFAAETFKRNPYLILTGDWTYELDRLQSWDGKSQVIGDRRDGRELLIIAKPNKTV